MPVAGAVQVVENDAVDALPVVIVPEPEMPVAAVHVLFEYSVNVTDPVGATDVVFTNVATSPTPVGVPTVIETGVAWVVIAGDPGFTATTSLAAPQVVVKALLAGSPV